MAADMGLPPPPPPKLSDALRRENMVSVSGKLGGVAGVLAGVHIWDGERNKRVRRLKYLDWNDLISISFNPTFVFFLFLIMFYLRLFFYYYGHDSAERQEKRENSTGSRGMMGIEPRSPGIGILI